MHKTKQVELSNENALKDLDLTVSICTQCYSEGLVKPTYPTPQHQGWKVSKGSNIHGLTQSTIIATEASE